MKVSRREERRMKVSALMRWVGPAAIAGGVFLVLSDLSGLPITIPYVSPASPSGYDAVGSGVILIALTLLLVGMAGLYASRPAPKRSGTKPLRDRQRRRPPGRAGAARWSWVPGSSCSSCSGNSAGYAEHEEEAFSG